MEVCTDDRCTFSASADLAAHRIWPVEEHQLNAISLGSVSDNQAQSPLHASTPRHDLRQAHHVAYQPVAKISLTGDLGLHHNHLVKASNLYHLDGLSDPKYPAVVDSEGPKG